MAEKDNITFETEENPGAIQISNEVVLVIAAQVLNDIKGIGLAASAAEGFVDKLVKKPVQRGVRIYLNDDAKEVDIDVHIVIDYGINIPEISWSIQEAVKRNVETMTDIKVHKINVFVDGVSLEKEPKPAKFKRSKREQGGVEQPIVQTENTENPQSPEPDLEEMLSDDPDNFDVI